MAIAVVKGTPLLYSSVICELLTALSQTCTLLITPVKELVLAELLAEPIESGALLVLIPVPVAVSVSISLSIASLIAFALVVPSQVTTILCHLPSVTSPAPILLI